MMQLVSLNFLILGGQFQIQKINIVLVIILVEQIFKMTTNLDFCAKWLHGLKDGTTAKYQIVKNLFSAQTSSALQRTLLCQASLIEDLLSDGFKFMLTARFQSDSIERRFGQYCQMSGGRFLVGVKVVYGVKGF